MFACIGRGPFPCVSVHHEVVLEAVAHQSAEKDEPHKLGVAFLDELGQR